MTTEAQQPEASGENDVWEAIAAFEQILEAMPEDTASLAVLAHAYGEIGDHAKAIDYLVRLGSILLKQEDVAAAVELLEKLTPYEADERIGELQSRIRTLVAGSMDEISSSASDPGASTAEEVDIDALCQFKVAEELSLAWNLMESGELTQDEYASVVQDLTELSSVDDDATVSVLHVLEARAFKGIDRIMSALVRDSATPFISLMDIEFQFQAVKLLPLQFCSVRGAIGFESVTEDLLVALLNPFDPQLRLDVEQVSGKKCHFYLARPSEFDALLKRYQQTMEEDDSEES